jgi:DNA repair protein RadC
VWQLYAPRLQDLPVEEFHVAVLDAQHRLERDVLVTRGILNSSLVHPREVFREAIAERRGGGDPRPQPPERGPLAEPGGPGGDRPARGAGRLLDIPVHDHVIVGRGRYASFAEAGLL